MFNRQTVFIGIYDGYVTPFKLLIQASSLLVGMEDLLFRNIFVKNCMDYLNLSRKHTSLNYTLGYRNWVDTSKGSKVAPSLRGSPNQKLGVY
jgi:hypothetical protein